MLCKRNETAKVATSITAGDCPRNGRKTILSMSSESTRTTAKQRTMPTETGQPRSEAKASAYAPAITSCP
jgi:hypothetical protein